MYDHPIVNDLTCKWNLKKNKIIETELIGGCQRQGAGGWVKWAEVARRYNFQL